MMNNQSVATQGGTGEGRRLRGGDKSNVCPEPHEATLCQWY